MTLTERIQLVRDKTCFGCLTCGHHSKDCKVRYICSKYCPTLLHDCNYQAQDVTRANVDIQSLRDASHNPENVNLATETMPVTTMILPVILRHPYSEKEVLVFAPIDTV